MNKRLVNTVDEAVARYGAIINGKWADEAKWMDILQMSEWFTAQVVGLDGKPCKRIYMNKDMHKPFLDALDLVKARGLEKELTSFDGCFVIRMQRGSTTSLSTHSYGLAVDLSAPENALGTEGSFSEELGKCFEDAGFIWGKRFKRKDPMHFQFAGF